jgi:hypothetical protein
MTIARRFSAGKWNSRANEVSGRRLCRSESVVPCGTLLPALAFPALTCRAFAYRRYAAGVRLVPPLGRKYAVEKCGDISVPHTVQPSLGDFSSKRFSNPALKAPGYFQLSLRDILFGARSMLGNKHQQRNEPSREESNLVQYDLLIAPFGAVL